jgi:hypothetical protein
MTLRSRAWEPLHPLGACLLCWCVAGPVLPGLEPAHLSADDLVAKTVAVQAQLGAGFTVLIERPFVVAGDEPPATVQDHARAIVRWTCTMLRKDFFSADPDTVYAIYLFKDKESYEANALRLFGAKPFTPYGYCSSEHHALVMNISTGGGTLVHEMVHAFMHGNVPDCPVWINEGLASLYEQCAERDGHIVGRVNWRLTGLKEALATDSAPSWERLAAMTDHAFYQDGVGANYATARYLLLWLQERGLLLRFWKAWRAGVGDDPRGLATVLALFPGETPAAVEARWKEWATALKDH